MTQLISDFYRDKKKTQIPVEILNSIYKRLEIFFYKLLEKLALMQKLMLEQDGPQIRRHQLYVPSLNPQNSLSVILAARALRVDESVISKIEETPLYSEFGSR